MHCRFCFTCFAQLEKHEAKCESEPTVKSLSRVVRDLLDRVEVQDRTISELKRARPAGASRSQVDFPELTENDLKLFLYTGIDSMIAANEWPIAVHGRTIHVCEAGEWVRAPDLSTQANAILRQLAVLFQPYVARKGWADFDPKGRFEENSLKVYGIAPAKVQQTLLKHAKAKDKK